MRRMVSEDIPKLKALWKKVFGDDDAYIDLFFEDLHRPDGGVVIFDNDTLAAMGFLVPIGEYDGRGALVTYAVACDPEYRGKGYGGVVSRKLKELAGEGAVICPASKSLFDFYNDKADYETAFFTSEYTFNNSNSCDGVITPVNAAQYAEMREEKLSDIPHIVFSQKAIHHQERICALTGGGLFSIDDGCCAVELWGGKIIIKELLVSDVKRAVSIISGAFKGDEIIVRCPAKDLINSRPFAMAKYGYDKKQPLPWFGFAFD